MKYWYGQRFSETMLKAELSKNQNLQKNYKKYELKMIISIQLKYVDEDFRKALYISLQGKIFKKVYYPNDL